MKLNKEICIDTESYLKLTYQYIL